MDTSFSAPPCTTSYGLHTVVRVVAKIESQVVVLKCEFINESLLINPLLEIKNVVAFCKLV